MVPLTGLPLTATDGVHGTDAAEHVRRVAALVGVRAFALVTSACVEHAAAANTWLVRHAWALLWTRGVEVHEIQIPITLTDYREGRWLSTAVPCLLIPGDDVRRLRALAWRVADQFGYGRAILHSAAGGLEAPWQRDGVLVADTGLLAEDWSRSPRFELVAATLPRPALLRAR